MIHKFITAICGGIMAAFISAPDVQAQTKNLVSYGVQLEELEFRRGDENEKLLAWNGDAFIGTDEIKLRWLGEGEYDLAPNTFETMENNLVLQTPISTFFDIKGGVRLDTPSGADRWYGVLGVTGLAPQWFEVDTDFFVSETGDTSARIDVEYELLITNRLILTPSAEVNVAFSGDPEIDIGSGVTGIEAGTRLSYDLIGRSLSPYMGFVYERKLGQTENLALAEGEDTEGWRVVIGTKLLF